VVIAVMTIPGGGDDDDRPDADSAAGKALAALEGSDPKGALKILMASQAEIANDPQGQLVLGHVYATLNESQPSLAAYNKALGLDPEVERDKKMRRSLSAMASLDKEPILAAAAFDVWIRTKDPAARELLLQAAVSEKLEHRWAVRKVVDARGLHDAVDWVASFSFDLQQHPDCEGRLEAVTKLRTLDDPRAISALQQAIAPKRGRSKLYNACLDDAARKAIRYLQGLVQAPAKAAPKAPPKKK
jgi:tetratricopeptide (TPR) repeat protein